MASTSALQVKSLRQKTGCGMMECKNALEEAGGDLDKAYTLLREKGLAKVEKKQGRQTTEGTAALFVHPTSRLAAVVEINTETDFAARNEEFIAFASSVAETLAHHPSTPDVASLLSLPLSGGPGQDISTSLATLVGKIGENVSVRRLAVLNTGDDLESVVVGYSHLGGKIATLVQFSGVPVESRDEFTRGMGKDIAMHVAASAPKYVDESEVPAEVIDAEKAIIEKTLASENKPADKIPMIARGKLSKFFEEFCVVKQKFVKEPKLTVTAALDNAQKGVSITSFVRFQLGEGLEKKSDDFAAEVAAQVSQSQPAP